MILSAVLLSRNALLTREWLVIVVVAIATFLSTVAIDITNASMQQACDDSIRGRVTGLATFGRGVAATAATVVATTVQVVLDEPELLALLGALAVAVIIATRGFRLSWPR